MDENLENQKQEDQRPLTAEERRANMEALLGEDAADKYFDGYEDFSSSSKSDADLYKATPSGANWRFIGIVAAIFIVVMAIAYMVVGNNVTEDDLGVVDSQYTNSSTP